MGRKATAMANTIDQAGKKIVVAEVVFAGEQIMIPENMKIKQAIEILVAREAYLDQATAIKEDYNVFPPDGANALNQCIARKYGWTQSVPTPGFWGDKPPSLIRVQTGVNTSVEVPWGRIVLPGIEGHLDTGVCQIRGCMGFQIVATVKRKHEADIRVLFKMVKEYLKENSIYQGKALKIRFRNDDGEKLPLPEPEFMPGNLDRKDMIYSKHIQEAIEVSLFTPIERHAELEANGIPFKRGVLLGGPFGTGKTLAATVASKLCMNNNITFVYVPRADELSDAVAFGQQYQVPGCVIFCEDIDRVLEGDRSVEMDDILNIVDGIDSKRCRIMTVLTTNAMEKINPAMIRPGRLDAVIYVDFPDAEAVQRLLRHYAGDTIEETTSLEEIGRMLKGANPAVIEEVVKRSKLAQLSVTHVGKLVQKISEEALVVTANSMHVQLGLLNKKDEEEAEPTFREMVEDAVSHSMNGGGEEFRAQMAHEVSKRVTKDVLRAFGKSS